MPMQSQAQRGWMWANKPEMAKRWEAETPDGIKLPARKRPRRRVRTEKDLHGFVNRMLDGHGPGQ